MSPNRFATLKFGGKGVKDLSEGLNILSIYSSTSTSTSTSGGGGSSSRSGSEKAAEDPPPLKLGDHTIGGGVAARRSPAYIGSRSGAAHWSLELAYIGSRSGLPTGFAQVARAREHHQ